MKNVINKIFSGNCDEEVHSEFVKFSKGVFENRYLIEGKRQADKWSIKTSGEFANFFVRKLLEKCGQQIKIKGIIVSTSDIEKDCKIPVENIKKYFGIKQIVIDCETSADNILELMNKHPKAFYALSFSVDGEELKIKAKPPKNGKPGTKNDNDGPKADFCSLKTSNKEIIEDLFFDCPNFKEIKISHAIEIKEIEIPENAKTPEEMREKAKRKGIVKRLVEVDGKKEVKEKSFVA